MATSFPEWEKYGSGWWTFRNCFADVGGVQPGVNFQASNPRGKRLLLKMPPGGGPGSPNLTKFRLVCDDVSITDITVVEWFPWDGEGRLISGMWLQLSRTPEAGHSWHLHLADGLQVFGERGEMSVADSILMAW